MPGSKSSTRSHGTKAQPPRLIIVCEGKTEVHLLENLRRRWKVASAEVQMAGEVGVPKTVVEKARSLATEKNVKRSNVWVVFDRDNHSCYSASINRALTLQLRLAVSNPCFEQWGVLLYEDQNKSLTQKQAQSQLKALTGSYCHRKNPYLVCDEVLPRIDAAEKRSTAQNQLRERDSDPWGGPMTRFSDVVSALRDARRK